MKTKIAATLVTLACAVSIGFPAAADDASAVRTQSAATATAVHPRPETSGRFDILNDVTVEAITSKALDTIRGAFIDGSYYNPAGTTAGSPWWYDYSGFGFSSGDYDIEGRFFDG